MQHPNQTTENVQEQLSPIISPAITLMFEGISKEKHEDANKTALIQNSMNSLALNSTGDEIENERISQICVGSDGKEMIHQQEKQDQIEFASNAIDDCKEFLRAKRYSLEPPVNVRPSMDSPS